MSRKQERKFENLTNRVVKLMNRLHELEMTFSRLKNESEELLRKMLSRQDGKNNRQ